LTTLKRGDADADGGGDGGGGDGGGDGGGAKAVIVVGATILDTAKPAEINSFSIVVTSVTTNFVSRAVVSENVVASTVNSTFNTESTAESFLRPAVTSTTDVIVIAAESTPKYFAIPVLKLVFLSSSNSAAL
jgi:CBS domain containing-hemolysin-like protein